MAHTVTKSSTIQGVPHPETEVVLSTVTVDNLESVSHYGPSGVRVHDAKLSVITAPTDGSQVSMEHIEASDSLTNNTAALRFRVPAGGSLAGAVLRVNFRFNAMKSGGINPP